MRVTVPAVVEPGEYQLVVRIEAPGRAVEEAALAVEVADIAADGAAGAGPGDDHGGGVGADLSGDVREDRGAVPGPAHPEHKAAAGQLDGLISGAAQGMTLFVEDIIPALRVDELGQVALDWEAYDRLMQPYMDGTAFEDRVPLAVWLAPVPPRRIRDSSTQLWQYIDLCAKHFATKRWTAVPVFMHPGWADRRAGSRRRRRNWRSCGRRRAR